MRDVHIREHRLKSGQKSYEYRFEAAIIDGKRKWITKSGFKTKTEARRAGLTALQQYESIGQVVAPSDMSFADYLDLWLKDDCMVDLKPTTVSNYQKKINNHIKPALGAYRLRSIKKEDLQMFILEMFDNGYAKNTLSCISGILSKSMNYAVDHKYLLYSPAVRLRLPKNRTPKNPTRSSEREYIPADVATAIFKRFPECEPSHIPLRLGYECGLRIGEAFALVWEDIDLENKTITVNRQAQWQQDSTRTTADKVLSNGHAASGDGFWYFANPKYNSFRTIEISDSLCELLKREQERQEAMKAYYGAAYTHYCAERSLAFGGKTNPTVAAINPINSVDIGSPVHFVCVRSNGTYISGRTMQHTSSVIRKNLHERFSYHALRHTHASILYESGLSDKYISERLGHKDDRITRDTYIHITEVSRAQGQEALNRIFNGAVY